MLNADSNCRPQGGVLQRELSFQGYGSKGNRNCRPKGGVLKKGSVSKALVAREGEGWDA